MFATFFFWDEGCVFLEEGMFLLLVLEIDDDQHRM